MLIVFEMYDSNYYFNTLLKLFKYYNIEKIAHLAKKFKILQE